jgi:hypothetical protein
MEERGDRQAANAYSADQRWDILFGTGRAGTPPCSKVRQINRGENRDVSETNAKVTGLWPKFANSISNQGIIRGETSDSRIIAGYSRIDREDLPDM